MWLPCPPAPAGACNRRGQRHQGRWLRLRHSGAHVARLLKTAEGGHMHLHRSGVGVTTSRRLGAPRGGGCRQRHAHRFTEVAPDALRLPRCASAARPPIWATRTATTPCGPPCPATSLSQSERPSVLMAFAAVQSSSQPQPAARRLPASKVPAPISHTLPQPCPWLHARCAYPPSKRSFLSHVAQRLNPLLTCHPPDTQLQHSVALVS